MGHMDQIAYKRVCVHPIMNLLHVIVLMVHVLVSLAILGDSVISWVCKNN